MMLDELAVPIVLAPLAGGPSTAKLAAAVSGAGGLGLLAAGYLTAGALAERIGRARELGAGGRLGVNVFVPGAGPAPPGAAAVTAAQAGADVLAVQGAEAGGHRSTFRDDPAEDRFGGHGLQALLALVCVRCGLPLVAAGGLMTGAGIAGVLAAADLAAALRQAAARLAAAAGGR